MNFLDIKQLQFIQKKDESLQLNYQQKEYHSIKLFCCFPLKEPKKYISVRYGEEEQEIGIIESIEQLSEENRKIVQKELNFRYFMPEITKIYSHKFRHHAHVFDIQTNAGRKKITVLNIIWNIFENPDKTIMLRDSDENYYLIKDYLNHPDKHIKYLYNFL